MPCLMIFMAIFLVCSSLVSIIHVASPVKHAAVPYPTLPVNVLNDIDRNRAKHGTAASLAGLSAITAHWETGESHYCPNVTL